MATNWIEEMELVLEIEELEERVAPQAIWDPDND
jgi:hypothetical protein